MIYKGKKSKSWSLRKEVEDVKRKKLACQSVVDLATYRAIQKDNYKPTILAVDDDEMMRNAMKRVLENEGYKVLLAEDAMAVSRLLETVVLDLILLDINLPWVDGLELCALLKKHPVLRDVPLVLVSGRKSPEDVEKGFEAGCDDYITKPFDINNMAHIVAKALNK
jgi:CheY-like chemotaxis protein